MKMSDSIGHSDSSITAQNELGTFAQLSYNPDLDPNDYHLVGPYKEHLSGITFSTDEKIKK